MTTETLTNFYRINVKTESIRILPFLIIFLVFYK